MQGVLVVEHAGTLLGDKQHLPVSAQVEVR